MCFVNKVLRQESTPFVFWRSTTTKIMASNKIAYRTIINRMESILEKELKELDVYIIKCHLVLEREMILFIEHKCKRKLKKPYKFHILQDIVDDMYEGFTFNAWAKKEHVMEFVRTLTEMRNTIAHHLHFEPQTMKRAIAAANEMTVGMVDKIDKPKIGMFNNALASISILLALTSGKKVYAISRKKPK